MMLLHLYGAGNQVHCMADFFEIDRLIDELARLYATACATAWFKIENKKPSQDEYRTKVAEFMRHFEYTLSTFQNTPKAESFRANAKKALEAEIEKVLAGQNKEVEKRYKYFVDYG
jgi:hypothetical protein